MVILAVIYPVPSVLHKIFVVTIFEVVVVCVEMVNLVAVNHEEAVFGFRRMADLLKVHLISWEHTLVLAPGLDFWDVSMC